MHSASGQRDCSCCFFMRRKVKSWCETLISTMGIVQSTSREKLAGRLAASTSWRVWILTGRVPSSSSSYFPNPATWKRPKTWGERECWPRLGRDPVGSRISNPNSVNGRDDKPGKDRATARVTSHMNTEHFFLVLWALKTDWLGLILKGFSASILMGEGEDTKESYKKLANIFLQR